MTHRSPHSLVSPPRVAREIAVLDYDRYTQLGNAGVAALMQEVEDKALASATNIGITRPFITKAWDLYAPGDGYDYPMYLCGPGAPRIATPMDVFTHVWHLDNPYAQYTVVVRCQDYLDSLDKSP